MNKPVFIAFEGIDGSGKSTQVKILEEAFKSKRLEVQTTCEPTREATGKLIREVFAHRIPAEQMTIAALFLADRIEHILRPETGIKSLMASGKSVITDRYYFSSYAYHSVYVDLNWVIELNRMPKKLLTPDLNIFIDVAPEIAFERIQQNRNTTEMYETLDNLVAVRNQYMRAFEMEKHHEKIVIVDGNQDVQRVAADIQRIIGDM